MDWRWPQYDLVVSGEARGLKIEQDGRAYVAAKWSLSSQVRTVFETAFAHGLHCLMQRNHPQERGLYETGSTRDYISFSSSFEHYWVFEVDPKSWTT